MSSFPQKRFDLYNFSIFRFPCCFYDDESNQIPTFIHEHFCLIVPHEHSNSQDLNAFLLNDFGDST